MCPPDYFGIEYEINPWMNMRRSAATPSSRAGSGSGSIRRCATWASAVDLLEPMPGPARPGLHGQRRAGLSTTCSSARGSGSASARARVPISRRGRGTTASTVVPLPEGMNFEGAGDALFCGETLFAGYRFRSDVRSHQWVGERLGVPVLPLELVDPRFYHLDTCFCPLAPDVAIYYPGAFDEYGRSVLKDRIPHLIEVSAEEAVSFSCNAVVVGRTVVLNEGAPKLAAALRDARLRRPAARVLRVHQVRRQRQVPDPADRRRGGGKLEACRANLLVLIGHPCAASSISHPRFQKHWPSGQATRRCAEKSCSTMSRATDVHHPSLAGHLNLAQAVLDQLHKRRALGLGGEEAPAPIIDPAECATHFQPVEGGPRPGRSS